MTPARRRIALVAAADQTRTALAAYLKKSGFEVHECDELAVTSGFAALVVISAHDTSSERLIGEVRSWIKTTKSQRLVVVTSKPTVLKDLVVSHEGRLHVLAAPAFGWDLVDALRTTAPTRPRGA